MNILRLLIVVAVVASTSACETMGVMASGALAGAGIVMAGVGIAEGDAVTAAAGGFLADAGFGAVSDDSESVLGSAVQAGFASGVAAETGDITALLDADSTDKLVQRLGDGDSPVGPGTFPTPGMGNAPASGDSSLNPGGSTFMAAEDGDAAVHGSTSYGTSDIPVSGGSCRAREQQVTRELAAAQARVDQGQGSICENSRLMRDVAYKMKEFLIACPINDPTGEMLAYVNDVIATTTRNASAICAN